MYRTSSHEPQYKRKQKYESSKWNRRRSSSDEEEEDSTDKSSEETCDSTSGSESFRKPSQTSSVWCEKHEVYSNVLRPETPEEKPYKGYSSVIKHDKITQKNLLSPFPSFMIPPVYKEVSGPPNYKIKSVRPATAKDQEHFLKPSKQIPKKHETFEEKEESVCHVHRNRTNRDSYDKHKNKQKEKSYCCKKDRTARILTCVPGVHLVHPPPALSRPSTQETRSPKQTSELRRPKTADREQVNSNKSTEERVKQKRTATGGQNKAEDVKVEKVICGNRGGDGEVQEKLVYVVEGKGKDVQKIETDLFTLNEILAIKKDLVELSEFAKKLKTLKEMSREREKGKNHESVCHCVPAADLLKDVNKRIEALEARQGELERGTQISQKGDSEPEPQLKMPLDSPSKNSSVPKQSAMTMVPSFPKVETITSKAEGFSNNSDIANELMEIKTELLKLEKRRMSKEVTRIPKVLPPVKDDRGIAVFTSKTYILTENLDRKREEMRRIEDEKANKEKSRNDVETDHVTRWLREVSPRPALRNGSNLCDSAVKEDFRVKKLSSPFKYEDFVNQEPQKNRAIKKDGKEEGDVAEHLKRSLHYRECIVTSSGKIFACVTNPKRQMEKPKIRYSESSGSIPTVFKTKEQSLKAQKRPPAEVGRSISAHEFSSPSEKTEKTFRNKNLKNLEVFEMKGKKQKEDKNEFVKRFQSLMPSTNEFLTGSSSQLLASVNLEGETTSLTIDSSGLQRNVAVLSYAATTTKSEKKEEKKKKKEKKKICKEEKRERKKACKEEKRERKKACKEERKRKKENRECKRRMRSKIKMRCENEGVEKYPEEHTCRRLLKIKKSCRTETCQNRDAITSEDTSQIHTCSNEEETSLNKCCEETMNFPSEECDSLELYRRLQCDRRRVKMKPSQQPESCLLKLFARNLDRMYTKSSTCSQNEKIRMRRFDNKSFARLIDESCPRKCNENKQPSRRQSSDYSHCTTHHKCHHHHQPRHNHCHCNHQHNLHHQEEKPRPECPKNCGCVSVFHQTEGTRNWSGVQTYTATCETSKSKEDNEKKCPKRNHNRKHHKHHKHKRKHKEKHKRRHHEREEDPCLKEEDEICLCTCEKCGNIHSVQRVKQKKENRKKYPQCLRKRSEIFPLFSFLSHFCKSKPRVSSRKSRCIRVCSDTKRRKERPREHRKSKGHKRKEHEGRESSIESLSDECSYPEKEKKEHKKKSKKHKKSKEHKRKDEEDKDSFESVSEECSCSEKEKKEHKKKSKKHKKSKEHKKKEQEDKDRENSSESLSEECSCSEKEKKHKKKSKKHKKSKEDKRKDEEDKGSFESVSDECSCPEKEKKEHKNKSKKQKKSKEDKRKKHKDRSSSGSFSKECSCLENEDKKEIKASKESICYKKVKCPKNMESFTCYKAKVKTSTAFTSNTTQTSPTISETSQSQGSSQNLTSKKPKSSVHSFWKSLGMHKFCRRHLLNRLRKKNNPETSSANLTEDPSKSSSMPTYKDVVELKEESKKSGKKSKKKKSKTGEKVEEKKKKKKKEKKKKKN